MRQVECDTWHMAHMGCWTLFKNFRSLALTVLRIVLSEGFLYIVTLQPYVISHFISFKFFWIFNPYPDWVTYYLVFSFGQHLLWWEGLFPFALWKMSSYNPWQNALIQNALFKKGIMNKSILSSGIGGHFERANVKCPFALSKMPFYIPWQNALIQNALLKKGILKKGILSRDIGGHF